MLLLRAQRNIRPHVSFLSRQISSTRSVLNYSPADAIFLPQLGVSFSYRWLRDSCQCSECVHPTNKQKLRSTSDVSKDPRPLKTNVDFSRLDIQWQDPSCTHESSYPFNWLRTYAFPEERKVFHKDLDRVLWNKSDISSSHSLFIPYDSILNSKQDLHSALLQLIRYGLVFLTGVPTQKTDDAHCEVRKLGKIFGRIRETFYGDVWDVASVLNSTNIAYTSIDLGLHMDLLYFQHPPRYQILHCLRNHVIGGTSYFVDAIRIAEALRKDNPEYFELLTKIPVPYHYINAGHHLQNSHPVIQLSQTQADTPKIEYINYSPPFQAPLFIDTPAEFYLAFGRFSKLLYSDEAPYRHTLHEGEAVIFDNRRVLHARTEFHDKDDSDDSGVASQVDGEPSRWLKGCYLEADDILDRQRTLT